MPIKTLPLNLPPGSQYPDSSAFFSHRDPLPGWDLQKFGNLSFGGRANFSVSNKDLVSLINESSKDLKHPEIQEIIQQGLSITRNQLHFTAEKNDIDPKNLITSRSAHCVGYATFFASSCNFLLKQHGLSDWEAKPQVGQLYVLATNVHRYFSSPFFKDHDFVSIENKNTGEVFAVDPTVSDYLRIEYVSYNSN